MYINVQAIILKAERAGERDKRLSIFTREKGRLLALALGAARPGARLAGATEPGVESRFRLWLGPRNPVARITGGTVLTSFPGLRTRWTRMTSALFLCEWTDRLTALEHPNPEKYDILRKALSALSDLPAQPAPVRLAFLMQFLERAGYTVGEEMLGERLHERWRPQVTELCRSDFSAFPALGDSAPLLEGRLMEFVAPLLGTPLKTPLHEHRLKTYLARSLG